MQGRSNRLCRGMKYYVVVLRGIIKCIVSKMITCCRRTHKGSREHICIDKIFGYDDNGTVLLLCVSIMLFFQLLHQQTFTLTLQLRPVAVFTQVSGYI